MIEYKDIILQINNLTCGYGGIPVLDNFGMELKAGEILAIEGPNGCGKSTLLKAIYQLCLIEKGEIYYNGINLNGKSPEIIKRMGIAYFMQKESIFTNLSVRENLLISLNGSPLKIKEQKISELLEEFQIIKSWLNKPAGLLSGGQRQQLSMAMLFAQNAKLWLLDEPTAGVDKKGIEILLKELKIQVKEKNVSIVLVEHNKEFIKNIASRSINLKG